jgi:putative ABC transport system permease protein
MQYWRTSTAIGAILGLGTAMGFLIGVIICYQILYTDVVDHLPQFATMKAIGYYNGVLVRVVLAQALVLALLGFVPGLVLSQVFYQGVARATGLLMRLTVPRAAFVLVLTVVMCAFAGSMAMRKVLSADPAEVF